MVRRYYKTGNSLFKLPRWTSPQDQPTSNRTTPIKLTGEEKDLLIRACECVSQSFWDENASYGAEESDSDNGESGGSSGGGSQLRHITKISYIPKCVGGKII